MRALASLCDHDETNGPGVTLLKAQMNADLLTDDLKKKRASNESFWLIGQPDVVVDSEQWIVDSKKEALAPYDIIAKLSGVDSPAKINGLGCDDLSLFIVIAERRDVWAAVATDKNDGVNSGQHRGGAGAARDWRVSAISGRHAGLLAELETLVILCGNLGFFPKESVATVLNDCEEIGKLLTGLVKSLRR